MALNIKNTEVEKLVAEVAAMTHVSKTEAIRVAMEERKAVLRKRESDRFKDVLCWLQQDVWPRVPETLTRPLTRDQEDELLGYGPDGV